MTQKNNDSDELKKEIKQAQRINTMWFEIFGFISSESRQNLIISIFTLLVLWSTLVTIFLYMEERKCSCEKQMIINHYEEKTDTLYNIIINLKK